VFHQSQKKNKKKTLEHFSNFLPMPSCVVSDLKHTFWQKKRKKGNSGKKKNKKNRIMSSYKLDKKAILKYRKKEFTLQSFNVHFTKTFTGTC